MGAFESIKDGAFAIGTMVMSDSLLTAEASAHSGFDFLLLDRQHGLIDDSTLWRQIAAIESAGTADAFVRIPWNTPAEAMRALDGGAKGIIAPMINDRAEAEALVKACRYPPEGERSWGPIRAGIRDAVGYTEKANASIFVGAMIETKPGWENLEEIASTPNLDALFVGPNDLSFALGNWQMGMPTDPDFIEVLKRIANAAKAHGKVAGIHCANAEMAVAVRDWGYSFVTVAADVAFLQEAARATVDKVRENTRSGLQENQGAGSVY